MKLNSNSDPYEDSGIATSEGIHSLEFDGSPIKTPPQIIRKTGTVSSRISTASTTTSTTLHQHYYPEGGWGWVIVVVAVLVQMLSHSLHLCAGLIIMAAQKRYNIRMIVDTGWLGGLSTAVALFLSPVTIAVCKKKSTRLTAVIGGLVTALGCLFTSFASQFHQLFFSYGAVVGVGVGMTRDCSTLMVAQYFKRKREFVEIFVVSGSGLGLAIMSNFIKSAIDAIGWRLGLQAVTGTIFTTFILGTFYRSASLYHPQRRAILHLKNQKRKIKEKNKQEQPPFFDYHTLRSKSVRIILLSTALSAFGINTPIFYLAHKVQMEGLGDKALTLQTYLGLAWILGCFAFGLLVVRNSMECRIARQYLCQTAIFMCALCILGLTTVEGNYNGYVMFVWVYGIFCGGYHYSLKMFTYEKVRARNFARAWGFVQCSQATIALGVPITGYLNQDGALIVGYYFSAICGILGSVSLFLIDLHRRNVAKSHKHTKSNGVTCVCVSDACPQKRKLSFSQEPDNEPGTLSANAAIVFGSELLIQPVNDIPLNISNGNTLGIEKPELTCISEEGIADMDLPDNLLNDFDDGMECITSSNRVENYLMMSEFENNLKAETVLSKRNKFVPNAKTKIVLNTRDLIEHHRDGEVQLTVDNDHHPPNGNGNGHGPPFLQHTAVHNNSNGHNKWKLSSAEGYLGNRGISVIDEASV